MRKLSLVLAVQFVVLFNTLVVNATEKVKPQIATGVGHTVALKSDGTLWAWGYNGGGQLGDGTTTDRHSPVQIGTDNNWISIAAGQWHTVAVKSDGTLWAWGYNNYGQLGDGTTSTRRSPVQIGSDANWVSIAAGWGHTIALKSDGTLWAWGYNWYGQLGDGTTIYRYSPVRIGSDANWVSIAAGMYHSMALKSDGTLWAWGFSCYGQLGDGTNSIRYSPVRIGSASNWVSIAATWNHSVGLKSDGTLWAWGYNIYGQVGDGTTTDRNSPVQIGTDTDWVSISAGYHTLALKSNGTLWAWGRNASGDLGDGSSVDRYVPVQIGSESNWVSIAAGAYHTVAVQSDGTLSAWGGNTYGQVGDGTTTDRYSPVQIMGDSKSVSITAGGFNTMVLNSDGTLWSSGWNSFGQVGDGTNADKLSLVKIGTDNNWVSITGGWLHTAAVKSDGTLWTWGDNRYGQIGDNSTTTRLSPVKVGTDHDWVSVAVGWGHTIALKSNGTLWAWGWNGLGQLGDNSTYNRYVPVRIGSDSNWVSIAAGETHTMALKSDGTLWAWGDDGDGQLGDGSCCTSKHFPIKIGSDTNWASISAGVYHSVALKSDGTLWAWGWNGDGQLGDGNISYSHSPVRIGSDNNWASIAAGGFHTAALKSNGTLWVWGDNEAGQAGDNSAPVDKYFPVQLGDPNWASIAAGRWHTVGKKSDGTLWAWGYNDDGELADGTRTWSYVPIPISLPNPDLVVQSIVTEPANPAAGQNITVTVTVRNQGLVDASAFVIDFYKHLTTPPGTGQYGDFTCNQSGLAAGATTTCIGTISYASTGAYSMYAQVDTGQTVSEGDEANNVYGPQNMVLQSVPITVTTFPTGLGVSVDGANYLSPQTFIWTPGTSHTIGVSSPQIVGNVMQYLFTSWSDGGTQTHTITVTSSPAIFTAAFDANALPTSQDSSITAEQNAVYTFQASHFPFSDADAGDSLQQVRISSLPVPGTLKLAETAIAAGDVIWRAALDDGNFTFTPDSNTSGVPYTTFQFEVSDGTGYSASAYTMTVNVLNTPMCNPTACPDGVVVTPATGVSVTFDTVTAAGQTTVTTADVDPNNPDACPGDENFMFLGQCYDITTTATYANDVKICLAYDQAQVPPPPFDEATLTFMHWETNPAPPPLEIWENRTISLDTVNNVICGTVSSFSWFAIAFDNTPPTFTLNRLEDTLFENHEMVKVATVTDVSDAADPSPDVDIQVTSNQSIDGDWDVRQTGGEWEVRVRAEQSGRDDRIYTINVAVTDKSGNQATAMHTVRVRHH